MTQGSTEVVSKEVNGFQRDDRVAQSDTKVARTFEGLFS